MLCMLGHVSRVCRSRWKCEICNGRHHSTICEVDKPHVGLPKKPEDSHRMNPEAVPFTTHSNMTVYVDSQSFYRPHRHEYITR